VIVVGAAANRILLGGPGRHFALARPVTALKRSLGALSALGLADPNGLDTAEFLVAGLALVKTGLSLAANKSTFDRNLINGRHLFM
jgi:hypothetical protein